MPRPLTPKMKHTPMKGLVVAIAVIALGIFALATQATSIPSNLPAIPANSARVTPTSSATQQTASEPVESLGVTMNNWQETTKKASNSKP